MDVWNNSSKSLPKPGVTQTQIKNLARFLADLYRRAVVEAHRDNQLTFLWSTIAGEMLERVAPGIQYDFDDCNHDIQASIQKHIANLEMQQHLEYDGFLLRADPDALRQTVVRSMAAQAAGWVGMSADQYDKAITLLGLASQSVPEALSDDAEKSATNPQLLSGNLITDLPPSPLET